MLGWGYILPNKNAPKATFVWDLMKEVGGEMDGGMVHSGVVSMVTENFCFLRMETLMVNRYGRCLKSICGHGCQGKQRTLTCRSMNGQQSL